MAKLKITNMVNKVSLKTAAQLINQFGSLQQIILSTDKIAKPSIRESIITDGERLRQNYQIIKLDNKAQLPFTIDMLAFEYNRITTNEVLKEIGLK